MISQINTLIARITSVDSDTIALIREYKQLLDEGIITQKEFDDKKKELLKSK